LASQALGGVVAVSQTLAQWLLDNNIVTQEQAAEELGKSIPKVMALRKGISDTIFDPLSIFNPWVENETVQ
jgi:butyrate kinase